MKTSNFEWPETEGSLQLNYNIALLIDSRKKQCKKKSL